MSTHRFMTLVLGASFLAFMFFAGCTIKIQEVRVFGKGNPISTPTVTP
jgi:hypothetical protein